MQPCAVVEGNDVIRHIALGLGLIGIAALPNTRHFQIQEEAFRHCVIPAIAFPAQAADGQSPIRNASQTSAAGILGAIAQPTTFREYKSSTMTRYSQPVSVRRSNITHKRPVRRWGIELPIQNIWQAMVAVRCVDAFPLPHRYQCFLAHQTPRFVTANPYPLCCHGIHQAAATVGLATGVESSTQMNDRWADRGSAAVDRPSAACLDQPHRAVRSRRV